MFCDGLRFSIDLAYSRRSAVEEMAGKKRSEVGWSWPFFLHSPLSESLERVNSEAEVASGAICGDATRSG